MTKKYKYKYKIRKLCFSTKFPHRKIRGNDRTLRNEIDMEWVSYEPSPFLFTQDYFVWAFLQLRKLNLTYYFKSSLVIAFCFLFVLDQNQMYSSSISPLEIFQGICIIEWLKRREGGGYFEPWTAGET